METGTGVIVGRIDSAAVEVVRFRSIARSDGTSLPLSLERIPSDVEGLAALRSLPPTIRENVLR